MLISRSSWRKVAATLAVAAGFVLLYETRVLDSRLSWRLKPSGNIEAPPQPGTRLLFSATAYCKGTTTASGVNVQSGIAAADPSLLPVGSVVQVDAPGARNDGIYTIMDTGPRVQGRHLDLYMWSCHEALAFGRTGVDIVVLRLGWNPQASSPRLIDRLFRRREAEPPPLPASGDRIPPATLPSPEPVPPLPSPPSESSAQPEPIQPPQ